MSDSSVYLSLEHCGGVCVCVCICARVRVCVHTVGVCGWLFVLNGHLYSSFMSTAAILRDIVVCVCARECVCLQI